MQMSSCPPLVKILRKLHMPLRMKSKFLRTVSEALQASSPDSAPCSSFRRAMPSFAARPSKMRLLLPQSACPLWLNRIWSHLKYHFWSLP